MKKYFYLLILTIAFASCKPSTDDAIAFNDIIHPEATIARPGTYAHDAVSQETVVATVSCMVSVLLVFIYYINQVKPI